MSGWVMLVPCPRVTREKIDFIATAARRVDAGLLADVQVFNGTLKWGSQIVLSSGEDRDQSAHGIGGSVSLALALIGEALLELHGLTEVQFRTQAAPAVAVEAFGGLPAFPLDVFPPWLRTYVREVAEFTQTPVDLAAMLALAVAALACQRFAVLEVRSGYREPLCLYILVAMESGERKSAVYRLIAQPVYDHEGMLRDEMGPEIARRATERKILEQSLQRAIQEAGKRDATPLDKAHALKVAEDLHRLVALPEPVLVIQDSTPESMIMELSEQDGTLAVLDAEGGLLDTLTGTRYNDAGPNLDPLLKAHAGDEIRSARVSRGRISIKQPMLTMGIAPQPDVLRGLADKPGAKKRGLLARFLYSLPQSRKGHRRQQSAAVSTPARMAYWQHLEVLLRAGDMPKAGTPREWAVVHLDAQALRLWDEFSAWLEPQLAPGASLAGTNGWAEKLAGGIARLAAHLHLLDGNDPAMQARSLVTGDAMTRAIRVGRDYLMPHGLASLHFMAVNPAVSDARAVQGWFERNGKETFSLRDAWCDLRARFARSEDLKPGMAHLVDCGIVSEIEEVRTGPGRKPSPRYIVNPESHAHYTQQEADAGGSDEAGGENPYAEHAEYAESVGDDDRNW